MEGRCIIGCGCGRGRKRKPLTAKQKENARNRSKKLSLDRRLRMKAENFRNKIIKIRLNICEKCPHSIQTSRDKKYKIRICHKQNRPIDVVSKVISSACPVGKFKASA